MRNYVEPLRSERSLRIVVMMLIKRYRRRRYIEAISLLRWKAPQTLAGEQMIFRLPKQTDQHRTRTIMAMGGQGQHFATLHASALTTDRLASCNVQLTDDRRSQESPPSNGTRWYQDKGTIQRQQRCLRALDKASPAVYGVQA
ncbi:uncharacterized protein UV8b_01636 [Ustilaginoidea virens]|uniref:Uncharacterized protein n=1 Tax=Ustilaginoidea virens TaxID=1159556 RepID=A0A8E5HL08_USTVR|nr:uncharacterized protein UV8b_01636 [Ustilaginoidea virens]QUC17395.1 hypothetical protein UV8b_01636 [Ustilaginoidea virens]